MIRAYCVPAVSDAGEPKVAVSETVAPLAAPEPGMVAVARSAPVGRPPLVARMETARSGGVAPQPRQKSGTSALTSFPLIAGIKVCPVQAGVPKPVPVVVPAVLDWSSCGAFSSLTSPGLLVRSQLVATPVWKSACVVSVKQPLAAAVLSAKFCVAVLPSATVIGPADAELYPG